MGTPWPTKEKHSRTWCDKPMLLPCSLHGPSSTETSLACSTTVESNTDDRLLKDIATGPLEEDFKFFMKAVPDCLTPAEIRNHFEKFGPVTYVKLFRDRGYGFLYMSNSVGAKAVKSYSIENKKSVKLPGSKYADVPAFFLAKSDQRREKPLCTVSSHDKFEIVFPRRELSLSNRKSDPKNNSTPSRSKGTYPPCAMAQSHNQSSRGYPRPVPYERSRLENEVWNVSHPFPYFPVFDNVGPFMTSLSTTTSGFHEVEMSTMAMYHSPYPPFFHCHTIDDMGYEASMIYYPYPLFCACTAPLIPTTKCESHVPDDKDDACHRKPQSSLYWK